MATYKLIQDIEAEDHILGPLTLRQFIFALIAAFLGYMCFFSITRHAAFLLVILAPITFFCAFFAFPWGGDQPTETWALAKLRFWFKPRKRVWSQSGIKELVTITVPKKIERVYSDGLSQREVKSRLQALANTIDSRGWAIKHINAVGYVTSPQNEDSERLINIPDVPAPAPEATPAGPVSDVMDSDSPIAQQFQNMIDKSTNDYRQRLMEQMQAPTNLGADAAQPAQPQQWFMNHNPVASQNMAAPAAATVSGWGAGAGVVTATAPAAQPVPGTADDQALSAELRSRAAAAPQAYSNLRTLRPLGATPINSADQQAADPAPAATDYQMADGVPAGAPTAVTAASDPAILSLSKNNDLNVATLAREAQRARQANEGARDEVVISLH